MGFKCEGCICRLKLNFEEKGKIGLTTHCEFINALKIPITLICAARKNEWNSVSSIVEKYDPREFELDYLSPKEIERILDQLDRCDGLKALDGLPRPQQVEIFTRSAQKQLLVALREVTEGKDFDEIVRDEYQNIPTAVAQKAYLYISALNRFGVPVRAGVLGRLVGVGLETLPEILHGPLERVVEVDRDFADGGFNYRNRHKIIAAIVCSQVLNTEDDHLNLYMDILSQLDTGYSADDRAFGQIVTSNELAKVLRSESSVDAFFGKCLDMSEGAAFVHQHYAIALKKLNDIQGASHQIALAKKSQPKNEAILHTYATILFEKFKSVSQLDGREKIFAQVQNVLTDLMKKNPHNDYAYGSYAQNLMYRARHEYVDNDLKCAAEEEAFEVINKGLQSCRNRTHLLATSGQLLEVVGKRKEALQHLMQSNKRDPGRARTAKFLYGIYFKEGRYEECVSTLMPAIERSPTDKVLNIMAARAVKKVKGQGSADELKFLRMAFDGSYVDSETNLNLAICQFVRGEIEKSLELFSELKMRRREIPAARVFKVRDEYKTEDEKPRTFKGKVVRMIDSGSGLVKADELSPDIFFQISNIATDHDRCAVGARVSFIVGFNYLGPVALEIKII